MEFKISFPGGKKVYATGDDGMVIKTDQAAKYGGEGSAPTPFALFLASIGTCAGIFVLSFCQERKIPTEGLEISERIEYVQTPDGHSVMDKIVLDIKVPAGFPQKYLGALIKVADQCAVKRAIANPPKFEVKTTQG